MLKGIPSLLSPDFIKVLMEMGHGDTIVIADGNFPAVSKASRLVRADGHAVADVLKAVLALMPLDTYGSDSPAALMAKVDKNEGPAGVWEDYRKIVKRDFPSFKDFKFHERFSFYEEAGKAFAVVATTDMTLYANIILRKGVLEEEV